ncbi:MAG TPA: GNAT family N-acetyltransferase [Acidimicrobiales bacterium]|nr:GNAT family N-acetyltransferase [Acidimicrobiales bacterium]
MIEIRPLLPAESDRSARMHQEVLGMEFLVRLGPRFLAAYHRAWACSPSGMALAAVEPRRGVVGVILGSVDPASHYRWMLVHAGPGLALRLIARSVTHPALGRDLVATRAARYAGAVWRHLATAEPPGPDASHRTGEVTHLMVSSEARRLGVGAALLAEAERRAVMAGVDEMVLVTPPDLDARRFYEHLGWESTGTMTSRSGEHFIRFSRRLRTAEVAGSREDVGLAQ